MGTVSEGPSKMDRTVLFLTFSILQVSSHYMYFNYNPFPYPYLGYFSPNVAFRPFLVTTTTQANGIDDKFHRLRQIFEKSFETDNITLTSILAQTEAIKDILKVFAEDEDATKFLVDKTRTLKSFDDALCVTNSMTDLIMDASPLLKDIQDKLEEIKIYRNMSYLLEKGAQILESLSALKDEGDAFAADMKCGSFVEKGSSGMLELADILEDMASNEKFPVDVKHQLKKSSEIVRASAKAIDNMSSIFQRFPKFCSEEPDFNVKAIQGLNDIFNEIESLFRALGSPKNLAELRQSYIIKVHNVANTIYLLRQQDIGLSECTSLESLKGSAEALRDISQIVQAVGEKELSETLGINLDISSLW